MSTTKMKKIYSVLRAAVIDILFPKSCINCAKEGDYLCPDCFSLIEIADRQYCPFCSAPRVVIDGKTCPSCHRNKKLTGLYSAVSYENPLAKKLLALFKYEPYVKELSEVLAFLIWSHFLNLEKDQNSFKDFVLLPVPLYIKKLKRRGFNQAEELGKWLAKFLAISLINDCLLKTKETPNQMGLAKEERIKNVKGVFYCQKPELVKNKKILLIDDVFTTGSTLEECALTLKSAGAKEVWGVVAARD